MVKRDRVDLFRSRLEGATTTIGMSKSALARATGVDRSTIGQLFKKDLTRLPNAQLAADIAETLGVSLDWLMGLSNRPERPAAILASAISVAQAERSSSGAQILDWHRESAGSKIRHVPATLPEMMKSSVFSISG
ncbi:MAG: helix-turn-helix transcriptional regulator, partial [Pseudomonadota bacterium]